MSSEAMRRALELAHEGVEIHSPNSPEYKVCAALIAITEAEKQEPVGKLLSDEFDGHKFVPYQNEWPFNVDLYTAPPQRKLPTNDEIKRLIVEGARKFESLGDWCSLVEYDPDIGRIPERWEPRYDVFHAASYVVRELYGIKEGEKL